MFLEISTKLKISNSVQWSKIVLKSGNTCEVRGLSYIIGVSNHIPTKNTSKFYTVDLLEKILSMTERNQRLLMIAVHFLI